MHVRRDIKLEDWIEIKHGGKTYLVAVKSLIRKWARSDERPRLNLTTPHF